MSASVVRPNIVRLHWTRSASLTVTPDDTGKTRANPEVWQCRDASGEEESFEVDVRYGKPLNVLGLKGTALDEIRQYAAFLKRAAAELYGPDIAEQSLEHCPCCSHPSDTAHEAFRAFDIPYHRCNGCGHVFVVRQPRGTALSEVFEDSEEHSSAYTDTNSLEIRLREIVRPKLDWCRQVYRRCHGRDAAAALDVGAGGGHFVEVCRRAGLRAEGYEISAPSRDFARQAFGLQLRGGDVLAEEDVDEDFDLVTLWGLLEYTPQPRKFLEAARRKLNLSDGLLVVEVPRFDCLSTAIQAIGHRHIARHMDPTSHVNCFSDESLLTALYVSGFRPVSAWYFGMDAYELLVQTALAVNDDSVLERTAEWIPRLQSALDSARLCDDLIVAAVPRTS